MMRALVLGAAALALSAGAGSAQPAYPSNGYGPYAAPLYDYAGPPGAGPRASHRYSPLIYAPQPYAPTPAFPTPPAEPGYYTVQSIVVSPPLYDYSPVIGVGDNSPLPAALV